ncbi:hypothetical protein Tco_0872923 [Tanacetum coccineum]
MKTPMSSDTKLTKDEECESVDSTKYRGMIGSLLYLTVSRPDIMFSVCLYARFQEAPKTSHLEAIMWTERALAVRGMLFDILVLEEINRLSSAHEANTWRLDELAYGIPFGIGPYQTNPPSIEDIISSIRIDSEGQVRSHPSWEGD